MGNRVVLILKQPRQVQLIDSRSGAPHEAQENLPQQGRMTGRGLKLLGRVRRQKGHWRIGDFLVVAVFFLFMAMIQ